MSKLLLLYCTFILGLLFMFIPDKVEPYDYFLFSDMQLYFGTYIYFICEKIVLIVLSYVVVNEATEYRGVIWIFFWLVCADLVDFLLCYGEVWFSLGSVPVSMNVVKAFVFGVVLINEGCKKYL